MAAKQRRRTSCMHRALLDRATRHLARASGSGALAAPAVATAAAAARAPRTRWGTSARQCRAATRRMARRLPGHRRRSARPTTAARSVARLRPPRGGVGARRCCATPAACAARKTLRPTPHLLRRGSSINPSSTCTTAGTSSTAQA
jgi:hypothetical protein